MNDPDALAPLTPVVQIGVLGLPNLTNAMVSGGLYVLIAETPSARFPMLAGSLGSALKEGLTCTVIVPANPELFIQRIEAFDSAITPELIAAKRLQLFEMQGEFSKTMFRYGAEGFVKELEYFDIPEDSYLIFDQADDLLSLHDITQALDQIETLKKWFEQRRVTALLVFSRITDAYSDTINALMDNLTGIVRLGGDKDGLELTFDYWQSPEGTIAARNYRLLTLASGLYEATTKVTRSEPAPDDDGYEPSAEAGDVEPHFFYMDPDLGSLAKAMPGVWQRVDTLVGMMHATRMIRWATSILSFQHDTNLRQLAEAVHTLRLSQGHYAHIVVLEKGASLRYQNEALLLRLGVNLVVHRDVPTSRLPLLLESLKGQVFNRDVNINFETALSSVTPTRLRGYLLPLRFAREVALILDRAETLNVPFAMVVGKPAQGATMIDLLAHIGFSREGDLFTADNSYCYLFLNACPQTVMLATLERILGMAVGAALDDIRFLVRRVEIDPELAALARAAEHGTLPDYSPPGGAPQAQESPAAGAAEAVPLFAQAASAAQVGSTSPIARVIKGLVPGDQRSRDLREPPASSTSARAPAAPQIKPSSTVAPVFGKNEAPRATRSLPVVEPDSAPKATRLIH